jgi:hypothetical protein
MTTQGRSDPMTTPPVPGSEAPGLVDATRTVSEAAQQLLGDSWRHTQELWNGVAANWGEAAGTWLRRTEMQQSGEAARIVQEVQDASVAAARAWLRLPVVLVGAAPVTEFPDALIRLTAAHGRAYQLWVSGLMGAGARTEGGR